MARTPKKPSPNTNANGGDLPKRVQNLEIENASIKAEKVGWWSWVKAHAASMVFVLSVMGGGFAFLYAELRILDAKIEAVETRLMAEINEVRTIAIRTEAKVDALLKLNLAQHDGDNATIEETSDTPSTPLGESPLGDSPIDASTDAPIASPTTTTQDNLPL